MALDGLARYLTLLNRRSADLGIVGILRINPIDLYLYNTAVLKQRDLPRTFITSLAPSLLPSL